MSTCDALISAQTISAFPALETQGFAARQPVPGPECELVTSYVASSLPPAPHDQARTIFIEPRVASGFPDIVVVYWHLPTARQWMVERATLSATDIRVLHFLAQNGPTNHTALRAAFPRGMGRALDHLLSASLVRQSGETWRARALERIFAVRRLIAIEAKIAEWRVGLAQALRNTWFASESYLLLGGRAPRPSMIGEARSLGVGVLIANQRLEYAVTTARRETLPASYASWLFNEWAWRAGCSVLAAPTDGRVRRPRRERTHDS